jgi:hypothetical protein
LFHRLGLNELSANEQKKLGAGDKWEQATLGGQNYLVHRNGQGAIIGAHDANGVTQDDTTLAKLNAGGAPYGSHQYNTSTEMYKAPDGTMLRSQTNTLSGQTHWVDAKNGQEWHGEGQPTPLRVETQTEIAQNKANIGVNAAGNRAYNTAAGKFNFQNQTNMPLQGGATNAGIVNPNRPVAPTVPTARPAATPIAGTQAPAQANPAPQPAVNPNAGLTPAQIEQRNKAQEKVGTTSAATVATAGQAEAKIQQAQHAIDIIDSGNHNLGGWIGGTVRGKGPIVQGIGQEVGQTEAARNTQNVMDVIRDIGATAAQSDIKGHLTGQQLDFITQYKPTATTDPQRTKEYIEKSMAAIRSAQAQAQAQVSGGGTAPNPVTTTHALGTKENPIKLQ